MVDSVSGQAESRAGGAIPTSFREHPFILADSKRHRAQHRAHSASPVDRHYIDRSVSQTSHLKSVTEHMSVFALRANTDINAATANRPGESAFVSRLGRSQPKFLGLTFHGNKKPSRC